MRKQIDKYVGKIQSHGIAASADVVFLCRDADVYSNKGEEEWPVWCREAFERLNVNAFLFVVPAEPYRSIMDHVVDSPATLFGRVEGSGGERVVPRDCETRTFFHDIPIVRGEDPARLFNALSLRKSAILARRGIAACGLFTPEQAFVALSSACFSLFVNYFANMLAFVEERAHQGEALDRELLRRFLRTWEVARAADEKAHVDCDAVSSSLAGPPLRREDVPAMLCEAGRSVVSHRLVDSSFGNISYVYGDRIFISQTGSSLDELDHCIDEIPLDGSSSAGITASSELPAHIAIHRATGDRAILHGHPKYAVTLSMCCPRRECEKKRCFTACPYEREMKGIPIVSGEIGTGATGLLHTVPEAMKKAHAAIVHGHGVFTSGRTDFRKPFQMLCDIEDVARDEYVRRLRNALRTGVSGLEHLLDSDRY